jgi:hypothetical protein
VLLDVVLGREGGTGRGGPAHVDRVVDEVGASKGSGSVGDGFA